MFFELIFLFRWVQKCHSIEEAIFANPINESAKVDSHEEMIQPTHEHEIVEMSDLSESQDEYR